MSTMPPPPLEPPTSPPKRTNKIAKAALIVAIVAFVLGCIPFVGFVSWLIAGAAIVLAIIPLTRTGLPKGMAVGGLTLGVLALIVGPIVAITSVVAAVGASTVAAGTASTPPVTQPSQIPTTAAATEAAPASPSAEPSTPTVDVKTKTYKGSGDKVIHVDYSDPLIITFTCSNCSGNTVLKTDSGTDTLPVNKIGAYSGTHILNTSDSSLLTRFVVNADAAWSLKIEDPATFGNRIKRVTAGHTVKGKGDDVIFVEAGVSDSDVENKGESNFVLKSFGGSDTLPVNEIGSYRGNVVLDGPAIVQVESDGSWKIHGNG